MFAAALMQKVCTHFAITLANQVAQGYIASHVIQLSRLGYCGCELQIRKFLRVSHYTRVDRSWEQPARGLSVSSLLRQYSSLTF